jgi:uncharacterized SAM-dependent methyltransferase
MLNIDESSYVVEMGYDEKQRQRFMKIRLKTAISVEFVLDGRERRVDLAKDDSILVWRAWHRTGPETIDQFDENGFNMLHASETTDHDYVLMISEIMTDNS